MQTFTYRVELFGTEQITRDGMDQFSQKLTEFGKLGWEAVSVVVVERPLDPVVVLFKRPG